MTIGEARCFRLRAANIFRDATRRSLPKLRRSANSFSTCGWDIVGDMPQKHHGAAVVAVRFRTERANLPRPAAPWGQVARRLKKKARSDTSLSERALPERSGESAPPADSETVMEHLWLGTSHGKIDCPNADEIVQRLAATGDRAGGSAPYSPMYSPVLWAPPGWAIPR